MTTLETLLNDTDMAGVWNLVPERSAVTFKIKNMWGLVRVKGRFTDVSANAQLSGKGAVSGRLDLRAASIDTGIARRDQHLRSADFFDAERFPEISVVVTAVHPTRGSAGELRADLTMKGVAAPLPLPVTITELSDGSIRISGETKVDRFQFGVSWNKAPGMIGKAATVAAEAVFARGAQ